MFFSASPPLFTHFYGLSTLAFYISDVTLLPPSHKPWSNHLSLSRSRSLSHEQTCLDIHLTYQVCNLSLRTNKRLDTVTSYFFLPFFKCCSELIGGLKKLKQAFSGGSLELHNKPPPQGCSTLKLPNSFPLTLNPLTVNPLTIRW